LSIAFAALAAEYVLSEPFFYLFAVWAVAEISLTPAPKKKGS